MNVDPWTTFKYMCAVRANKRLVGERKAYPLACAQVRPPVEHIFGGGPPAAGEAPAPVSVFRHRLLQHFMLSVFCKLPIKQMTCMRDIRRAPQCFPLSSGQVASPQQTCRCQPTVCECSQQQQLLAAHRARPSTSAWLSKCSFFCPPCARCRQLPAFRN